MSARRVAQLAALLLLLYALLGEGPVLAGRSRLALAGLALALATGLPRAPRPAARPIAFAVLAGLLLPPLGLAFALDRASACDGRGTLERATLAACVLGLVLAAAAASQVAGRGLWAARIHALLWSVLALGLPLALANLRWIARIEPPAVLVRLARLSPLAWLAESVRASDPGSGGALALALCGALLLLFVPWGFARGRGTSA